jgi:hypothetical protein
VDSLGGDSGSIAGLPAAAPDAAAGPRALPEWPLALVVAVVAIGGALALITSEWGKGGPQKVAEAVADHGSMFDDGRFPAALRAITEEVGPTAGVLMLRVDAGQVWTVVGTATGSRRVVRIRTDDSRDVQAAGGRAAPEAGIPLALVDPGAPSRILQTVRRRFEIAPERVDYLSLVDLPTLKPVWNVYLRADEGAVAGQLTADEHGGHMRRVG